MLKTGKTSTTKVSLSCSSAVQKSSRNWAAEEIATAVKQGRFNDDTFTADPTSVQLSVDYLCQDGQVLRVVEADNVTRTCCEFFCFCFCMFWFFLFFVVLFYWRWVGGGGVDFMMDFIPSILLLCVLGGNPK